MSVPKHAWPSSVSSGHHVMSDTQHKGGWVPPPAHALVFILYSVLVCICADRLAVTMTRGTSRERWCARSAQQRRRKWGVCRSESVTVPRWCTPIWSGNSSTSLNYEERLILCSAVFSIMVELPKITRYNHTCRFFGSKTRRRRRSHFENLPSLSYFLCIRTD